MSRTTHHIPQVFIVLDLLLCQPDFSSSGDSLAGFHEKSHCVTLALAEIYSVGGSLGGGVEGDWHGTDEGGIAWGFLLLMCICVLPYILKQFVLFI